MNRRSFLRGLGAAMATTAVVPLVPVAVAGFGASTMTGADMVRRGRDFVWTAGKLFERIDGFERYIPDPEGLDFGDKRQPHGGPHA